MIEETLSLSTKPLAIGVCSWSLQVKSVVELKRLLDRLGIDVVQIACGDSRHAAWDEGDRLPEVARAAGFHMTSAMLSFPGEDYTTPQTIQHTGGFGDAAKCAERLQRLLWGVERTRALGLTDLTLHAGFIPEPGSPDRKPFLEALSRASEIARGKSVTLAFETGQETAGLLRLTLDELKCPNLKVNFDPANMLLYDKGDPLRAVEVLAPDIRSVHVKDANRPKVPGTWGRKCRWARDRSTFGSSSKRCKRSAIVVRCASSVRWGIRSSAWRTSPTVFAICAKV